MKTPPAPGSDEAIELGCLCPVLDNAHGRGYMGMPSIFVWNEACLLHFPKEFRAVPLDPKS